MVEILCPHCEEEIELDDDAVGEFSCPYCDGEFEWGEPEEEEADLDFGNFNKVHSGTTGLIYKPAMLAFTLVMVIITVVGLNSGSWYGASVTMEEGDLEGEINYDFGLAEAEFSSSVSYRGGDTTQSSNIFGYGDMEKELLEESDNEGIDCEAPWAEYNCEEVAEMVELADWWRDWDSSGSLLNFFLIMSIIFFIIILISKILLILDEKGNMKLPANLIEVLNKGDNISTFVTGILLLSGCVSYAIMMPGEMDGYTFWWSHDTGADVTVGMGMIWWTTLLLSIGYFSASIRGLVSDYN